MALFFYFKKTSNFFYEEMTKSRSLHIFFAFEYGAGGHEICTDLHEWQR